MNIVFYSTSAAQFDFDAVELTTAPCRSAVWQELAARYREHRFFIVTQAPASFLLDSALLQAARARAPVTVGDATAHCLTLCDTVHISLLTAETPASAVAAYIATLQPDLALAASFWLAPYDWLGLQDALVADALRAQGIRTLCHAASLSLDCFDKSRTHALLERHGFAMPKAVYVHHELYWCERRHHTLTTNVYKDYVLSELRKLHYPVVIKDTVGLSSYSLEVAVSYKQAVAYLNSGRTKVDRLVEEYIAGDQFGCEIYGSDGRYTVLPPLLFSLNRYGVTSPKQSVKLGGGLELAARFGFAALESRLRALAEQLQPAGVMQVDLVRAHADGRWYIIELNPRLSGMSETYAALLGLPLMELLLRTELSLPLAPAAMPMAPVQSAVPSPVSRAAAPPLQQPALPCVCNLKLALISEEQRAALAKEPAVAYLQRLYNRAAKQERERGYCELVLRAPTLTALMAALDDLAARYADCMESAFVAKAHELASRLL